MKENQYNLVSYIVKIIPHPTKLWQLFVLPGEIIQTDWNTSPIIY